MKIYLSCLVCIMLMNHLNLSLSQERDTAVFLVKEPQMDGAIYNDIISIPPKSFKEIQPEGTVSVIPDASYRLAYGMGFLYVMVEVNSESIIYRDRAYQNGDGLLITVAKPKPDMTEADEYFVLGFSPGDVLKNIKAKKFIWYRNMDLVFLNLKDSKFCTTVINNKTYLQALIYWKEIYPFYPAMEEGMGINICFVKADGENNKINYFTTPDYKMQSEQSTRNYDVIGFAKPPKLEKPQIYCMLSQSSITVKNGVDLFAFCIGKPKCIVNLKITVKGEDSDYYNTNDFALYNEIGCTKMTFNVPVEHLGPGNYIIHWNDGDFSRGDIKFTILPEFKYDKLKSDLELSASKISKGSYNTLQFMLNDTKSHYEKLKNYEPCPGLLKDISDISQLIKKASEGNDSLYKRDGCFRRFFISEIDDSLRPYTIRVPKNLNRFDLYPLLVYLHGSGDDDRAAFKMNSLSEGRFIELFPNGRGTSNVYCTEESQKDIAEAIADAVINYPVDTSKIIISGFSMGGYGAYKTFFDNPGKFKAIAVFSGHPNLANEWLEGTYVSFLEKKNCTVFKWKQMFIFHGTEDLNAPFGLTKILKENLDSVKAEVLFVTEETGHSAPSEGTMKKFRKWLDIAFTIPFIIDGD